MAKTICIAKCFFGGKLYRIADEGPELKAKDGKLYLPTDEEFEKPVNHFQIFEEEKKPAKEPAKEPAKK